MKRTLKYFLILLATQWLGIVRAEVVPASVFGHNMVLQRNVEVPVWGKAWPGETIEVVLNKVKVATRADKDGNWMLKLPKQKAGGPYKLEIIADNIIVYNDVYLGDVWFCSGQSNIDRAHIVTGKQIGRAHV